MLKISEDGLELLRGLQALSLLPRLSLRRLRHKLGIRIQLHLHDPRDHGRCLPQLLLTDGQALLLDLFWSGGWFCAYIQLEAWSLLRSGWNSDRQDPRRLLAHPVGPV